MITLDRSHPAIVQIMEGRLTPNPETRLMKLDVDAVDFDNVVYRCSAAPDSTDLRVDVTIAHWDVIGKLGCEEAAEKAFGQWKVPTADGYSMSFEFKGGDASPIEPFSRFYNTVLAAAFVHVLAGTTPTEIPFRDNLRCFVVPSGENAGVTFGLRESNDEMRRLKRVFIQEMATEKLAGAPTVRFSDEPPGDVAAMLDGKKDHLIAGWLTFTLFPKHRKSVAAAEALAGFYPFLQFHIKCCLAYIHYRERFKTNEFLSVLNRARPEEPKNKSK